MTRNATAGHSVMRTALTALILCAVTYANTAQSGFERLHDFDGTDGMDTYNRVVRHGNTLYTTTVRGGAADKGTLVAYHLDTANLQVLHHFDGVNGRSPFNLNAVLDGSLWGVTRSDEVNYAGTLYRYEFETGVVQLEHRFGGGGDAGHHLFYGPTAVDGKLYGLTNEGGTSDQGTLYQYDPADGSFATLHHFTPGQGTRPFAGLIELDGWLVGTVSDITLREQSDPPNTAFGGIFRIRPDGTDYSLVHQFAGGHDGAHPYGNLLYDGDTWLYGTTLGEYNNLDDEGVVFRIRSDFTDYEVIHNFSAQSGDGSKPNGDVVLSDDGTTLYGFAHGSLTAPLGDGSPYFGTQVEAGTLFSLRSDGTDFTVLHTFDSSENGLVPERTPVLFENTLYGAAAHGGEYTSIDRSQGMGTLFGYTLDDPDDTPSATPVDTTNKANAGALDPVWLLSFLLFGAARMSSLPQPKRLRANAIRRL